jgi:hypothetical protein
MNSDPPEKKKMKKTVLIGSIATTALATTLTVAGATTANAAECSPAVGTSAHLGAWMRTGDTDVHHDAAVPADPDGQNGEDNPANLVKLGSPEITEHVTNPAGAAREVFDHWQRYSWTGGPVEGDTAPAFPGPGWQPNVAGDPHGIGTQGAYFESRGGSGNGDWFYLEPVTTTQPGTPAVSHSDYVWPILERTYTEGTDPVTCEAPEDPTDSEESIEPERPSHPANQTDPSERRAPATRTEHDGRAGLGAGAAVTGTPVAHISRVQAHQVASVNHVPAAVHAAVPTTIDAGL